MQKEKVIVILFDFQRTINNLSEKNVIYLLQQIDVLRKYFQANKAIISISTHLYTPYPLKKYLDILEKHKTDSIVIDDSFYLFGTYNHLTNNKTEIGFGYNLDKIKNFEDKYFTSYDVVWFALIDDSLTSNIITKYQNHSPMIACAPSQRQQNFFEHFMFYSSTKQGVEGISSCLNKYIDKVMSFDSDEILEVQKRCKSNISLENILFHQDYWQLKNYLQSFILEKEEYEIIALFINSVIKNQNYKPEDMLVIKEVMQIICNVLQNNHKLIFEYKEISQG